MLDPYRKTLLEIFSDNSSEFCYSFDFDHEKPYEYIVNSDESLQELVNVKNITYSYFRTSIACWGECKRDLLFGVYFENGS